ncbi:uncharacterized protein LOC107272372 isoform X2 [Cephus cinctus]|nr:uncharacterized protein LOC107272372 isoform X2 [Cephus cinctus]
MRYPSEMSFQAYPNIATLSLDEIKEMFPWLKSKEPVVLESNDKNAPRYVFYYKPEQVVLKNKITGREKNSRDQEANEFLKRGFLHQERNFLPGGLNHRSEGYRHNDDIVEDPDIFTAETKNGPVHSHPKVPSPYLEPPTVSEKDRNLYSLEKRKLIINLLRARKNRARQKLLNQKLNSKEKEKTEDKEIKYVRDHAPENQMEDTSEIKDEATEEQQVKKKPNNPLELSPDGDRVQFHIHGHEGPKTYIFGFDTGNGKNRHYRLEERLKDGTIKGHYGYYDARGKLRMVQYTARPLGGYQEKHHESSHPKDKS